MADIRKIVTMRETICVEMGEPLARPIVRVAAAAVMTNPFAGIFADDLRQLHEAGRTIGEQLSNDITAMLPGPAVSYGKAAVVGLAGELEHGGACIHPMLGKPMRNAIGGGEAVIPSNAKVASPATPIDVPLGHKDNVWSFDHFDTMTVSIADAPRPDEIVVILAFADGGRPFPRCGSAPA